MQWFSYSTRGGCCYSSLFQADYRSSPRSNKMEEVGLSPSFGYIKIIFNSTGHIPNPAKSTFVFPVVLVLFYHILDVF